MTGRDDFNGQWRLTYSSVGLFTQLEAYLGHLSKAKGLRPRLFAKDEPWTLNSCLDTRPTLYRIIDVLLYSTNPLTLELPPEPLPSESHNRVQRITSYNPARSSHTSNLPMKLHVCQCPG